ncbi:DUF211 domain-containing protein [Thermococcus celer]|uniref:DUF211 domain-containing protein n=1 Tax=Thermococcus celer Vu 13 = JCM 8558 TaxID=1293037 RepID=A0A218P0M4_THECE|nr:DUF211 domain-containing protein [Thermococcus celer]ASI98453.1 hypothetical protein A3L02_02160 [Thermococcus celer Vu 13 = JCM 8558]
MLYLFSNYPPSGDVDFDGVNITLVEIDKETENIKITIVGDNLDYEEIVRTIEEFGGVVHSIDMVAAGKRIIEESETPQDSLEEY